MVDSNEIARELSSIDKLIDSLINIDAKVRDALWKRQARSILRRLRELYFREDGTLGFLRMVAKGEPVQQSDLNKVKSTFRGRDHAVYAAIQDLKAKCDLHNINLTLDDVQFLESLISNKTVIRLEVEKILSALESGDIGDGVRRRAGQICRKIDDLNAKFCSVDRQLRKHI